MVKEPSSNPETAEGRSPPETGDKSGAPAAGHPSRRPHLLEVTLDGMPELEQFPTDAEREAALGEIAQEAANLKSGSFWLGVAILIISVVAVRMVVRWALNRVVWYYWLEEAIVWVSIGLTFWLVLRRLHRWGAGEELRAKLLKAGVPVCMKCGYSLRGLPLSPGRCPECGAEFDPRAREILSRNAETPPPRRVNPPEADPPSEDSMRSRSVKLSSRNGAIWGLLFLALVPPTGGCNRPSKAPAEQRGPKTSAAPSKPPTKIDSFSGQYRFLSNFWPAEIEHEGITYPSVEHAYQAAKTLDAAERRRIAALPTPSEAKKAGQELRQRPDWERAKFVVMEECVRYKFMHHADLREWLLDTGDAYLEEGNSWGDRVWGVYQGQGENRLGKILMKIRSELRAGR